MQHFFRKRIPLKRVLSIQSYVVSGYVGNKAATLPLQVLGYDVDPINSVQRSNHTGHKHFDGQVLKANDLKVLYDSLAKNGVNRYSHLLTGYCADASFVSEIASIYNQVKATNKDLIYVCDPAFGDNGNFYEDVNKACYPIYRQLIQHADIITPNQFEAEVLTDISITTEERAFQAIKELHMQGPRIVVLTSASFDGDNLVLMASSKQFPDEYVRIEFERLGAMFYGTGDLFTSLLLAWSHEHPNDLKLALQKSVSSMQVVLDRTLSTAQELYGYRKKLTPGQLELKIVQSIDEIRDPPILFDASIVNLGVERRRRRISLRRRFR